jgi:hypothetical protein
MPSPRPRLASLALSLLALCVLAIGALTTAGTGASAQGGGARRGGRGAPRAVPPDATVTWTVFVSAHGDTPSRRSVAGAEPGEIAVPVEGWSCRYGPPTRAQLDDTNWSEVRTLECTHGEGIVSTTGFCQIAGASWGARAGVLALGGRNEPSRVTVTLDCAVVE